METILAIDDDPRILKLIVKILKVNDYKVVTASKTAQSASDASASMIVINDQMIKDRGYLCPAYRESGRLLYGQKSLWRPLLAGGKNRAVQTGR